MGRINTKQVLVETGSTLFLERGYNETGLNDILAAAAVPKGSFYHHFRSKEDFALEVVNQYGDGVLEYLESLLRDESRAPLDRIRGFFETVFEEFKSKDCRHGCLLGNLGQELAEAHSRIRVAIEGHLERWVDAIARCLEEAVVTGEVPPGTDTRELAGLMIDGFQGAALRMKLEQHPAALSRYLGHFFAARAVA